MFLNVLWESCLYLLGESSSVIFHTADKMQNLQLYLMGHGDDGAGEGRCGIHYALFSANVLMFYEWMYEKEVCMLCLKTGVKVQKVTYYINRHKKKRGKHIKLPICLMFMMFSSFQVIKKSFKSFITKVFKNNSLFKVLKRKRKKKIYSAFF